MSKLSEYKDLIHELADLLDKSTLSEIEVEENDFRIRVARQISGGVNYTVPQAPAMAAAMPATAPVAAPAMAAADHPGAINAPMVGTAYASASPDDAPFIQVGSKVTEGDTLLIIEAMKVMNHIAAPKSGTVKEIHFSDSQPVEYGEVLCIVE